MTRTQPHCAATTPLSPWSRVGSSSLSCVSSSTTSSSGSCYVPASWPPRCGTKRRRSNRGRAKNGSGGSADAVVRRRNSSIYRGVTWCVIGQRLLTFRLDSSAAWFGSVFSDFCILSERRAAVFVDAGTGSRGSSRRTCGTGTPGVRPRTRRAGKVKPFMRPADEQMRFFSFFSGFSLHLFDNLSSHVVAKCTDIILCSFSEFLWLGFVLGCLGNRVICGCFLSDGLLASNSLPW